MTAVGLLLILREVASSVASVVASVRVTFVRRALVHSSAISTSIGTRVEVSSGGPAHRAHAWTLDVSRMERLLLIVSSNTKSLEVEVFILASLNSTNLLVRSVV